MRFDCTVTLAALAMCTRAAFSGVLPVPTSPADGATVAVHTAVQDDFLERSMSERRTCLEDATYFSGLRPSVAGPWDETSSNAHTANAASAYPKPVTLSWTGTGPFSVTVRRATDDVAVFSAEGLTANSIDVFNLEINRTYRWTVSNADGVSSSATFTTEDVYPRLLWDYDPKGRIFGIRDIGGAVGLDGRRVRQGVIFRSSELSGCDGSGCSKGASLISDANRGFWLDELGVRFELDLRDSNQTGITKSPLGTGVGYAQISGSDYGNIFDVFDWQGKISENSDTNLVKKALRTVIECVQDASKHPLVMHCQLGKDRTGTLAFLLEALLGVSEDDARRDWEASFFWYHKNRTNLDAVVNGLANYAGSTLAERTCSYVKSIGITDAEIATFRGAMLEPAESAEPPVEPEVDPTEYGAADTSAITYVWKGGSAPWTYTTSWTPSRTPCHGIPDAKVAVVQFLALAEASSVTLRDVGVNVRRMDFANTAALALRLDNGRITVAAGTSANKTTVEIGKTGPATVTFKGANPQIKTLSEYANGRLIFGTDAAVSFTTTLAFVLPAKAWTAQTAPILSAGTDSPLRFHPNVRFAVDATALGALAAGMSVTNVLAYNNDGVRVSDASILENAELICPDGTTGELLKIGSTLSFVLSGPAKEPPQPPAPPEQETEPDDYWTSTPFPAANTVICYGDSITYGEKGASLVVPDAPNYFDGRLAGRTGIDNYPYRLSTLLPAEYNVIAQAKSGKTADAIMSWAGGVPVRSVCDVTLPAAANENVAMPQNFLYYGTDPGGQYKNTGNAAYYGLLTPVVPLIEPLTVSSGDSLTGWFGGVHVRIGGNHADERVICRTDAGEGPVTVPAGTRFFPDNAITYRDAIKVICAGTNDGVARRETYVSQIEDGVTNTPSSRYVVLSPYQSEFLAGESQDQATPTETERLFAARFGEHCVNTRLALKERGLGIAVRLGLMTQAEADAAIWNDTKTGKGLMPVGDATHLNSTGYAVLAYLVKEKLLALGYVSDPDAPTGTATVTLDATAPGGRVLPNVVSSLTVWGGFDRAAYPEFLDWAILFTATGGNAERDLFADPSDESTTDDYDFSRLLANCRNVLACGMKPYLHLGNVPVKFTKGCDPRRARLGGADGGSYGFNIRPPDDYAAYGAYMKAVANALVAEFGRDEVRSWRFSVLTEANNRHWFEAKDGTAASTKAAFFRLYDHTVKAFTDVLGDDIAIGTHLLGLDATSDMSTFTYTDFIAHCKSGANDATGGTGAPLNLFAFSYYFDHPDDDKANPKAGRMTDFATLRTALDKAGFSRAIVCMDEGRVYSTKNGGTNEDELVSRAVGQSWQAAFDVRAAKSAFDAGGDNFASWGHLSGPDSKIEGLPTASWFTARELAKFAGMRQLSPSVTATLASTKEQVDAIAAVDAKGTTVRLAVCRFRDKLTFADRARATLALTLPETMRGKTAELSVLALDDTNNWFSDWLADRKAYNIGATCFGSSQDDQAPLMTLSDENARTLFAETLQPKYAERAASVVPRVTALEVPADGAVALPVDLVGNAAVFVTIAVEPPEPSAEREFPEKLVFTGATSKDGLYFITDYVPNLATTRMEMKFRLNDVASQSSGLFVANGWTAGKTEAGNGTRVEYYYNKNGRTPWLNYTCGGAKVDVSGFNDTKDFHVLVAEGGSFLFDGVERPTAVEREPSGMADGPLVIAAMMLGSDSYYNFPKMELAYFKVSERRGDGTYRLVHDYRPGTNSSGEATLYDLVSQTCLTPTAAGTGKKALAAGGGAVDVDVVEPVVGGARSGDSVVPVGFDAGDFRIAAGGSTLTCGSRSYTKPHYVFAGTANGGIVVRIDPDEATIAGFGFDADGNAVITTGKAFEDFRYRVEQTVTLPFGDFDATEYQTLGASRALVVPLIGSSGFYRVRVIDR